MPTIGELQAFKADFFRALGHPVRIRLVEELGQGERTVAELQQALGIPQPLVSQQLAVLRGRELVSTRKSGANVVYALRDPLLVDLLAVARRIFENRLTDTTAMLRALRREAR
ncbi:MAG: metalloregulator ArsR/SmtB family transcription factor [Candidatus Binatia bacterium]|jgi:DNA-binding transcriptional ArsR family regulator